MGIAADRADVIIALERLGVLNGLLIQVGVDFLDGAGKTEVLGNLFVALFLGVLDHTGVHLGVLVSLALEGVLEVGGRIANLSGVTQMSVGMDGLGGSGSAEKLGDLGFALLIRNLSIGEVFAVCLRFAGKSIHKIVKSFAHVFLLHLIQIPRIARPSSTRSENTAQ